MSDSDKLTDEDPMPVFTIKAKDNLAPDTIRHYGMLCRERGLHEQHTQVILAESEINAWRSRNPDALKDPDHKHVAARGSVTLPNAEEQERDADLVGEIASLRARLASLETALREAHTAYGLMRQYAQAAGSRAQASPTALREHWNDAERAIERAALSAAPSTGEEEG